MESSSPGQAPRGAAISLGQFLFAKFLVLALCLAAMVGVGLQGLRWSQYYLARCTAAQQQLAVATRIEANVSAMLLARITGRSEDQHRVSVRRGVSEYLRATDREIGLVAAHGLPATEEREEAVAARRLAAMVARIEADGDGSGVALLELQRMIHVIAEREQAEVAEAAREMDEMQVHSTHLGSFILALAALVAGATGLLLWRLVVQPIRALGAATAAVSNGGRSIRVEPRGIAEIRDLAVLFNDMAAEIGRQVETRTADLTASNRQLAEIDRTRRLFFAKVSHELRTPLTVIRGEADVALRDGGAEPRVLRDALDHVSANAAFLQRRLDDLLATARSDDGLIQLALAPIDLADVLRSAVEVVSPYAQSSEVTIAPSLPSGSVPIEGDAGWLRQALLAILDNAVKFAGHDGRISAACAFRQDMAEIRIGDSGPGVSVEDMPNLFDPYFQGAAGRARGGSGLGLALARWIVERHHGTIAAGAAEEGGLLITIQLPVRR